MGVPWRAQLLAHLAGVVLAAGEGLGGRAGRPRGEERGSHHPQPVPPSLSWEPSSPAVLGGFRRPSPPRRAPFPRSQADALQGATRLPAATFREIAVRCCPGTGGVVGGVTSNNRPNKHRGKSGALSIPANISYVFDESNCILSVQWDDVRPSPRNSCDYYTGLFTGNAWVEEKWSEALSKKMAVPLGKNMSFGLRMSCNNTVEGELFKIPLEQNGTAETGATNVSCICHNMEWMACSWKRGRLAPWDTNYHLSFWHDNLEERQRCTNHSVDGDTFRCIFPINCSGQRTLVLSIRSDSEDIQPVCVLTKEGTEKSDYPIKLHPPTNLKVKRFNNLYLTWNASSSWNGICYQVETNGIKKEPSEDDTTVPLNLEPKKYHILRVRAVLGKIASGCKEVRGLWSEWSEPVYWDERENFETLHIILFVTIPLCAAVLTIILLVYLKRIQLLIFPIIPDPEKVLKRMLEDQREEYLPFEYPSEFIKPDTIKTDYKMS